MEANTYPRKNTIIIIGCFILMLVFWFIPPVEPLTQTGVRVIGVFIGTVLLFSFCDSVWPALFAIALLSLTGIAPLNTIIAGSLGSWIIFFILMSLIMTHSLSESGFISRFVAIFMSNKFVNRSPWTFTIAIGCLGMILGCFMDQVPAAAVMLAFCERVYQELGYGYNDKYPHITNMLAVFGVIIGGAMTPISHALIILGLGIYQGATGNAISLFTYLVYGVPTGLVIFILMAIMFRVFAKPDFSRFENFDVQTVLDKQKKMGKRELVTVILFFATVVLWILPGILKLFIPASGIVAFLDQYSITFWAIICVTLMSIIPIEGRPLVTPKIVVNKNINWAILIFLSTSVYFGSAVCDPATGVTDFISQNISPFASNASIFVIIFIFAVVTVLFTNAASNVTAITVMTSVAVAVAMATSTVNPIVVAMITAFCGSCAYTLPSGSVQAALLHSHDYHNSATIYKYGLGMCVITIVVVTISGFITGSIIV